MSDQTYAETYPGLLPDCPCFRQEAGAADIPEAGQNYLGIAAQLGGEVSSLLLAANLCPVALPMVLATIASSVMTGMCASRTGTASPAEMMPEVRDMFDRLMAALPPELERVSRGAAMFGVKGSC